MWATPLGVSPQRFTPLPLTALEVVVPSRCLSPVPFHGMHWPWEAHTSLLPQTMGEQAAPAAPSPPPLPPVSQAALAPASHLQDALGEQPAQEAESVLAPGVKDLPPALMCGRS